MSSDDAELRGSSNRDNDADNSYNNNSENNKTIEMLLPNDKTAEEEEEWCRRW